MNPICKAMTEFKREAEASRTLISNHGADAIRSALFKKEKAVDSAKN